LVAVDFDLARVTGWEDDSNLAAAGV